jgi:hydroxyacylglutathione hydrolase
MILVKTFVFNEFQVNTYILSDETNECIIIDPGCNNQWQQNELKNYIDTMALKPVMLVNTHGHIDHIAGDLFVTTTYKISLALHEKDSFLLENALHFARLFSFRSDEAPVPDLFLKEGDKINFGHTAMSVMHIPGHSPGSIVLYTEKDKLLITGDVLFNGSVGRSDLPGGDHRALINGIRLKLMVLPRDTVVYPGHGPDTTIGEEYDTNPFLQDR